MAEDALFLLAGRGRRLGEMGDDLPKCLVSVGGMPMLQRMLLQLKARGCRRAIMVTGYLGDAIRNFCGSRWNGIKIDYIENREWESTNNIVSLFRASGSVTNDILLIEGDIVLKDGLLETIGGDGNWMAVSPFMEHMDGTVVTLDGTRVKRILLKGDSERDNADDLYKSVNIYRLTKDTMNGMIFPEMERIIETGRSGVYYEQAFANLVNRRVFGFEAVTFPDSRWAEVDNENDLILANAIFS
jgi:NDP-sugar pyrophosphorylase family protein